jgi:hypothetical protein
MLSYLDGTDRGRNRSLLFLIEGGSEVAALTRVDAACRDLLASGPSGFEWFDVVDREQLASVDPNLRTDRVTTIEAVELGLLRDDEIRAVLTPALRQMRSELDEPLFPSAGGAVGGAAEGVQFIDRVSALNEIQEALAAGVDVVLDAPRRSGKTSLLLRLGKELRNTHLPVYWDMERHATVEDNIARLASLMTENSFRQAKERASDDWRAFLADLISTLVSRAAAEGTGIVLLLIDELVLLLERIAPGPSGADAIRLLLEGLATSLGDRPIRMVVAGSRSLDELLTEQGFEIRDLPDRFASAKHCPLGPLAAEDPLLELRRVLLGTGLVVDDHEAEWLLSNIDFSLPFAAFSFLSHLRAEVGRNGTLAIEGLEPCLETFLTKTDAFRELERHVASFGEKAPGGSAGAAAILDQLATTGHLSLDHARSIAERHSPGAGASVCDWLEETFPIARTGSELRLVSPLFRRWWRQEHC